MSILLFDLGRVSQGSPRTLSSIKQKWSLALSLPLATGSHTGVHSTAFSSLLRHKCECYR